MTAKSKFESRPYHLAFVGSGIASTFTLLSFLRNILHSNAAHPIRIAVIEKYPEFFTGIPYGQRSGSTTLLITSLEDFLPEPQLQEYIEWLNLHKEELIELFLKEGGRLSEKWYANHQDEIARNSWKNIFVPRRFFGIYIHKKITEAIHLAEAAGKVTVTLIEDHITDVDRRDSSYFLKGERYCIESEQVVLGIGSPPTKSIWDSNQWDANTKVLLIPDLYSPSLDERLSQVKDFIRQIGRTDYRIMIIGANASALEILYKLNDTEEIGSRVSRFYFLSSLGLIPDSKVDHELLKTYRPNHTLNLLSESSLTAEKIATAVYQDLEEAEAKHIGAATTLGPISKAFGDLLSHLNTEERRIFACRYGNDIGRRQRCAGAHYAGVVERLRADNRFKHLAGRYLGLSNDEGKGVILEYRSRDTGEISATPPLDIVINCLGGAQLEDDQINALYGHLMGKGICVPNESNRGFTVNDHLEASPNFFVTGPLLAGNVIEGRALWHLEHCGRIIWTSGFLGAKLSERITNAKYKKTNV